MNSGFHKKEKSGHRTVTGFFYACNIWPVRVLVMHDRVITITDNNTQAI
jgi:hypothetical protein